MHRPSAVLAAILALIGAPSARAQGLPPAERVPGLTGVVVDLDVSGARWAVVFDDGSVRIHDPDGADTRLRPPRVGSDESDDAVLRVEGLLDEISSEDEDLPDFEDPEVEEVPEVEPEDDMSDQLEELLQGESSLAPGQSASGGTGIVRWGVGDRVAVGRGDGIWVSEDAGHRWERLSRDVARDLADTGTEWIALLQDGRMLIDGSRARVTLGPVALEIVDLAASDGTVWAATDLGLWSYGPAGWSPAGDDLLSIGAVVADPGWEGGVWTTGEAGIRRTDDGGLSWRNLEGGPLRGRLRWGGPAPGGSLLVAAENLWLHREGGWIRDPRRVDLAIGTDAGLFALSDGTLLAPPLAIPDSGAPPEWIPLGNLMFTALSRRELSESVGASRMVQTLMPEVTVEGTYSPNRGTSYLPFTTSTTAGDRTIVVRLKWTPAGRSGAGEAYDNTVDEIALRTGFDDLGINGDRAMGAVMGGRVGRNASAYRHKLTDEIRDLYAARNALFFERAALPPQNLLDEVAWELRRDELEARLDALTDGAVTTWTHDANSGPSAANDSL